MKQILIKTVMLVTLFFGLQKYSQAGSPITKNNYMAGFSILATFDRNVIPVTESQVNVKAVRHFRTLYPEASNLQWNMIGNQYQVSYHAEDITVKNVYGRNGSLVYSLKNYKEKFLPEQINQLVKSVYYDYDVVLVQELNIALKNIFIVKLENSKSMKTIRISDDQMDILEEYTKP
jgi:hypothetical protein